jgi:hypothetical protein
MRRPAPFRKSGNIVSEGGVVDLVDEDPKKGRGFVIRVRLKFGVDLDDKCRGDC